jgi:putative acetyltransferase
VLEIRVETETDHGPIRRLTETAFSGKPYAGGDEQDVIDNLRKACALTLSLVATDNSEVVGQATFSPAEISSNTGVWFALGPISVAPERQGERIGEQLIEAGIEHISKLGASGCILTGDPNYYSRHGFEVASEHCPANEPGEYFQLRMIGPERPIGTFRFHDAFYEGDADAKPPPNNI